MALTITPKRICTAILPTTADTLYTSPDDTTTRIDSATLFNNSPSEETYSLWAPTGGAATNANVLALTLSVPGQSRVEVAALKGRVVEAGWSIIGAGSTLNVLTLVADGFHVTETT